MDTSREDVGIAIRSAFLKKDIQQRFSLFALVLFAILLLFVDKIETKPLNYFRSITKDLIYRGSLVVSYPITTSKSLVGFVQYHLSVHKEYNKLQKEYNDLKNRAYNSDFLLLENNQLRKLIEEQIESKSNLVSARVILDKQSPYLNSFIINIGTNKEIKNGMAVLDGKNFIGRIVDVNFFSSRVLLISDLNSKIPVIVEPSGNHALLSGRGIVNPILEYLPENNKIQEGDKVYTSGKEGIFKPGIPIGEVEYDENQINVSLFSDLNQITFVNINLEHLEGK